MERRKYPIRAEDYRLFEQVGKGVSATVHRALCVPLDEIVAIKILDFERNNSDLNNISREAQTMILIDHPNVLKAHCSFVNGHDLWVVMPYMAGGSCLHIMKSVYPNGFEEVIIATILREVLKGLEYLHHDGHIHRDIKAGNILVDARGGIKLGDFGVSAYLFDSGDRQRRRNTFVGTPCWMAPEVMEQLHGYNVKADIWSFGITALELAHGHAPFSKYPPMKVLLMTLQNAPPGLDYERDKKFSRSFKQMIAMCLVKDPSKRPTAQKLSKHSFFKQARSGDYISRKVLEGLPSLVDRYQALMEKEEDLLAQKKMADEQKEELSQSEYKRGISSWNFDIEDLKTRASMIPENDDSHPVKYFERCPSFLFELGSMQDGIPEDISFSRSCSIREHIDMLENDSMPQTKSAALSPDQATSSQRSVSDGIDNEFMAFSSGDLSVNGLQLNSKLKESCFSGIFATESEEKHSDSVLTQTCHDRKISTSSCSSDICPSVKGESFKQQNQHQNSGSCSEGVSNIWNDSLPEAIPRVPKPLGKATHTEELDDKLKAPMVQQKGRFKVTSENIEIEKAIPTPLLPKSHSLQVISQLSTSCASSSSDVMSNIVSHSVFLQLNHILQANIHQRDNILSLMRQLFSGDISASVGNRLLEGACVLSPTAATEKLSLENEREKELLHEFTDAQLRYIAAHEELQRFRARHALG